MTTLIEWQTDNTLGRVLTARSAAKQVLWRIDEFERQIETGLLTADELAVIAAKMSALADELRRLETGFYEAAQ